MQLDILNSTPMLSAPHSPFHQRRSLFTRWLILATLLIAFGIIATHAAKPTKALPSWIASVPMQFEANEGQTDARTRFLARGAHYTVFFSSTEAVLSLRAGNGQPEASLHMTLADGNAAHELEGVEELPGTANYFVGNDPSRWHTSIRTFGKVKYHDVYPGIDLVYYGNQQQLEYDFVVEPGAAPEQIALRFAGAERLTLDAQGELIVHLKGGDVRWHRPIVCQITSTGRRDIPASFSLRNTDTIAFQIAAYDKTLPLIIDPVLVYSTYLGGSGDDFLGSITADGNGNVYVIGDTSSLNYPTTNAYDATANGSNEVFITKLNPSGSNIVFSTYLGGKGDDYSGGIAVDVSSNVYVTGETYSSDFPTKNAFQGSRAGFGDVFVSKLGPFGTNLLYSTYYGGPQDESGTCITVDDSGRAYVGGYTWSGRNFPVSGTRFQSKAGGYPADGNQDAFVLKFNTGSSGSSSRVYGSFLGGSSDESAYGIAVDASGDAYVVGVVADDYTPVGSAPSSDFPTLNAFQSDFNQGSTNIYSGITDGFLTKINPSGSAMLFSTFLGGGDEDSIWDIAVDSSNRVYLVGETASLDFPIRNAAQPIIGGGTNSDFSNPDAFMTEFAAAGTNILYSTYLGGAGYETAFSFFRFGIAVDKFGLVYITGETASLDFPVTTGADLTNAVGSSDAFVAKINPTISGPASLIYATLWGGDTDIYGGGASSYGMAIALDTNGNFFIGGMTSSTNYPTTPGAYDRTYNGGYYETYVAKFSSPPDLSLVMSPSIEPVIVGSNLTYTIQINNNGWTAFHGVTNTVKLPANAQITGVSSSAGTWTTNNGVLRFNIGTLTNNAVVTQTVTIAPFTLTPLTNVATVTATESELNTINNTDTEISTVRGITDVGITNTATPSTLLATSNFVYTIILTNKGPWPATSVVVTDTLPSTVSFVSATLSQGTWTNTGNSVTCNIGTMPVGSNAIITFNAVAGSTAGTFTNMSGVTFYEVDLVSSNNTAKAALTINALSDLILKQTASTNITYVGSNFVYTTVITNRGPSTATSVMLTNWLPPGMTYVSATSSQGTPTQTNGIVTCSIGSISSNSTVTVTITVKPSASVVGTITNKATTLPSSTDPVLTNNTVSLTTTVVPAADLMVTQNGAPNATVVGSNIVFTILVTNLGPSAATGVTLNNVLPSMFSLVSASASQGSSSSSGGTITFNLGGITNGGNATATVIGKANWDGTANNTANVAAATADLNSLNNNANFAVTISENTNMPLLRISVAGTNALLMWTTNAPGFTLQQTTDLLPVNWILVTNTPIILSNRFAVTNQLTPPRSFFRLIK